MDKIIVNFTPTGMIPTKKDTPYVPISPEEIIREVKDAWELGISMVHVHARNSDDEKPTYRKEVYAEIISGIRQFAPELVICASTSGRNFNTVEARTDVLSLEGDLKPDMGSLTLSSLNFNRTTSVNEPSMIVALAERMRDNGIRPELEAFDLGMVNYCNYLIKKGAVTAPYYVNLILGNIACAQGDLLHIGCMLKDIPEDSIFSLGAVGSDQLKMNSLGITMGWGVRVGLEDNFWYDENRTRLATNMDLLNRIHKLISANEKEVMTSKELRQKLNLDPGFGKYGVAGSNA